MNLAKDSMLDRLPFWVVLFAAAASCAKPSVSVKAQAAQPSSIPTVSQQTQSDQAASQFSTDSPSSSAPSPESESCRIEGVAHPSADTAIYDAARGASVVATFTGAGVAITMNGVPASGNNGRASVDIGKPSGFVISGFVDLEALPVLSQRRIAVVKDHVFIEAGQQVAVVDSRAGTLKVRYEPHRSLAGAFEGWAGCKDLGFDRPRPAPASQIPGNAQSYLFRRGDLSLFSQAGGGNAPASTLELAPGKAPLLFYALQTEGSWARVLHEGDLVIDAWVPLSKLEALPPGELVDHVQPAAREEGPATLTLGSDARAVRAAGAGTIRLGPKLDAKPVGRVAAGSELFVVDVVLGWASVLPKSLFVNSVEGTHFWVKASELGL